MTKKNVQDWLRENFSNQKESITAITFEGIDEELEGELLLEDYVALEHLHLEPGSDKEKGGVTKVTFNNCPNLKKAHLNRNEIQEVIFTSNCDNLERLDLSDNKLTKLDLSKTPNLKCFHAPTNPSFSGEILGLEYLTNLEEFNLPKDHGLNNKKYKAEIEGLKQVLGAEVAEHLPRSWEALLFLKLGGKNFKDIPNEAQNLKTLIEYFENRVPPTTPRKSESEAEKLIKKIVNILSLGNNATNEKILQKIQDLVKNAPQQGNCNHHDYAGVKAENERLKAENEALKSSKKEIFVKETQSNLKKWFAVPQDQATKVQKAKSAYEVEVIKNQVIDEQVQKLKDKNKNSLYLNIGLGTLTASSFLILGLLTVKEINSTKVKQVKGKEKKKIKKH